MPSLLDRAAAIRARNEILCTVPGSGYHDSDTDAWGKLRSPQCRHYPNGQEPGAQPLPPISEHLVAFYDDRTVTFVGECAEKAFAALKAYHADYSQRLMDFVEGKSGYQLKGTEYKLVREIPRLKIDDGKLVLWMDTWNDFVHALYEQGIGLTGAPLSDS